MSHTKRIAINTGILYLRMAITVCMSLYTTRLILQTLGAEDFGLFNLIGGSIAMLTFLNASMATATQRFISIAHVQGDEGKQHNIFNVSMVLHAVIALLMLAVLEGVGYILFNGVLKIEPERINVAWVVYQFAAISTFFSILAVPYDAVINAHEHMLLFAILGVIEALLKLGIAFIIADAATDKLELYGLLMAVLSVILLLIRVSYCHAKYNECELKLRSYFNYSLFKEMTVFAGWSLLGISTSMISNYGQGLVLNMFFGARVNAAQSIANQISGQLGALAGAMQRALAPLIVKSEGAGNRKLMLKASMMGSKVSFFLLMIFFVPVLLETPYLLEIWLKDVPDDAVIFCRLLLMRNLVEQLFMTLISAITATGVIKGFQKINSILTFLTLPFAYFYFYIGYDPYIIYVIFFIHSLITLIVVMYFCSKILQLSKKLYFWNVIMRCILTFLFSIGFGYISLQVMEAGFSRLIFNSLMFFLLFIITVWWIGFNKEERYSIKKLVYSRVNLK